jgi:hypothetical protein
VSDETKPLDNPDGVTPPEDLSGLKKALDAERSARRELERQIKADQQAKDSERTKLEQAELERKGEWEKLKTSVETEKANLAKERDAAHHKYRTHLTRTAAIEAIAAADGIPEALLPHVESALEVVQGPDGSDQVLVKGAPGTSVKDFVASLRDSKAWGFKGTGANGGGAPPPGGKPSTQTKTMPRSQFFQLSPTAQLAHTRAGGTVTD